MELQKTSEWAEILTAAGHPVRLMILAELLEGPKCVTTIHELLKVRQSNASQHLSVLKHSGLVSFTQDGGFRCYYLPKPAQAKAIFKLLEGDYPTVSSEEVKKKFRRARKQPKSNGLKNS